MPSELWSFVAVAALVVVVPGADMALVARNTLVGGRSAGFRTAAGTLLGLGIHVCAASLGLSAVIAASSTAFGIVRLAGTVYLVWLGVQTLRGTFRPADPGAELLSPRESGSSRAPLVQGMVTNLLNPKLAVFFLSFLPQFVDISKPAGLQIVTLGGTFVLMGAIWLGSYVAAVDRIAGVLMRPNVKRWLDRAIGATLIAFGIRLAMTTSE